MIENRVSLTRSVIDSSKKLKPEDFDLEYQENEKNALLELKSTILARFPDYLESLNKIEGLYSIYWGEQRTLLMANREKDEKSYSLMQQNIIITTNKMSSEVNCLIRVR